MTDSINGVMQRHLAQLKKEITGYANEDELWKVDGEILNSAGTLCLHICGNLQHFVGAVLGNSGYIRQRDEEFSLRNVPVNDLLALVDTTMNIVAETLNHLSEEVIKNDYPQEVFGNPMTTEYFLIHLTSHLGYHLGQINYHRRLLGSE
jgi:uncharacterized damage-inducible protein DinB